MRKHLLLMAIILLLFMVSGCSPKQEELMLHVEIIGEGVLVPDPDRPRYSKGETIKVTGLPADGYIFAEFVINGEVFTQNPVSIHLTENTKVKVVFYKKADYRTITTNIQGDGTVKRTPDNNNLYEKNQEVVLAAQPGTNWYFDHWEGDADGNNQMITITMDTDKTVTAVFKPYASYYVLTCQTQGEGTVTRYPLRTAFSSEETVTITAVPAAGWIFDHWEGDLAGTDSSISMQLKKDTTAIAVFKRKEYQININIEGGGYVTKSPDKSSYLTGEKVTITAVPEAGWIFDRWGGSLQGKEITQTITMTDDINVTAYYRDKVNIRLNKSDTGQPVIADYPSQVNVGETLTINLNWYYSSGGRTYYLKVDSVSVTPASSYNLEPVSLSGGNASQVITINNVQKDLDIFIEIGEYFKIDTVVYRPDGTIFPTSVVTISESPAPSFTVYGTSGLYKKGQVVTFSVPPLLSAHKFWHWGSELGGYGNNPINYTVYKSTTIEAFYDRI